MKKGNFTGNVCNLQSFHPSMIWEGEMNIFKSSVIQLSVLRCVRLELMIYNKTSPAAVTCSTRKNSVSMWECIT